MPLADHSPASAPPPPDDAHLSPYDCPICGELPRGCSCLRPSVRNRIADAIHFPTEPSTAFLSLVTAPSLEPPPSAPGQAAA